MGTSVMQTHLFLMEPEDGRKFPKNDPPSHNFYFAGKLCLGIGSGTARQHDFTFLGQD